MERNRWREIDRYIIFNIMDRDTPILYPNMDMNPHRHTASGFTDSNSNLLLAAWEISLRLIQSERFGILMDFCCEGMVKKLRNKNPKFSPILTKFSPILSKFRVGSEKLPTEFYRKPLLLHLPPRN